MIRGRVMVVYANGGPPLNRFIHYLVLDDRIALLCSIADITERPDLHKRGLAT
jgi:hypothetical protein